MTWIKPPGPVAPGMQVGLLGGSFNPAHEGHLHVSDVALKRLGLDYVWWLVSPQNPLKPSRGMASFRERLAAAQAIARHHPRARVSDLENRMATRYTIDTVTRLQRRFPQLHFVWLMGSDNLVTFHRWRNWQQLMRRIPIAVVMRPGTSLAPLRSKAALRFAGARCRSEQMLARARPPAFAILDARRSPASATELRAKALVRRSAAC
jgi:nicotinate-nucleotide adenylyltransferase